MTIENPGSFNNFVENHPDIPDTDKVKEYTGRLAAYHADVTDTNPSSLSPDFMLIQAGGDVTEPAFAKAS